MTLTIYDGNNFARRRFEHDPTGFAPRNIMIDINRITHPVIWVWDAIDGSRRRKAIYPGYKKNRGPLDRTIFDGFQVVEEVLKHTPAIQIKVPGYEADDVIATLVRFYGRKGEQIDIKSNDFDFVQLCGEFPNKVFCGAPLKPNVPPKLIWLYKVCVGDPSDCIAGIPGFGKDTWEKSDKKQLAKLINTVVQTGTVPDQNFLPKRCKLDAENIRATWEVVSFFDVPMPEINAHMSPGRLNYAAADAFLKRFMQ